MSHLPFADFPFAEQVRVPVVNYRFTDPATHEQRIVQLILQPSKAHESKETDKNFRIRVEFTFSEVHPEPPHLTSEVQDDDEVIDAWLEAQERYEKTFWLVVDNGDGTVSNLSNELIKGPDLKWDFCSHLLADVLDYINGCLLDTPWRLSDYSVTIGGVSTIAEAPMSSMETAYRTAHAPLKKQASFKGSRLWGTAPQITLNEFRVIAATGTTKMFKPRM